MLKPQPQDIPSPSLRGGGAGGGGKGDPQTKFVRHVTLSTHGPCTKPGGTIEGLANPAPVAALSHSNAIVVCGSGHGCRNNAASQLRPALRAASGGRASGQRTCRFLGGMLVQVPPPVISCATAARVSSH